MKKIRKKYLFLANNSVVDGGAAKIFYQLYINWKKRYPETKIATVDVLDEGLKLKDSLISKLDILFNYYNYKILDRYIKKEKINVVFLHNHIPNLSMSIWLALKKNKVKVFYTLHQFDLICPNGSLYCTGKKKICEECIGKKVKTNILRNNCSNKGKKYDIAKFFLSLERYFFKIDKIIYKYIVPSNFLKEKLKAEGITSKKIKVIENFIDTTFWNDKIELKKGNNIVYFGRFSEEKNVLFLIKAIEELRKEGNDLKLFLIGNGPEKKIYKDYIRKEKLEDSVIIIDKFMKSDELKIILKNMKISVLPSKVYETFGLTIIESIYSNVIPLTSDLGGMKETINTSYGFTFKNGDLKDLKNKLLFLLNNYEKIMKRLIEEKYKLKNKYNVENYCNILEEMVNAEI